MKKKAKIQLIFGAILLIVFVLYTVSLKFVDIRQIGPEGSSVAYGGINDAVHKLFGVNMTLYEITDWAGVAAILVALCFAALGFVQLIKRKKLFKVDHGILLLGVFYIVVFGTYVFFEFNVINRRPELIEGVLEASYPSSTTMLATCVLPTAMIQLSRLVKNKKIRYAINIFLGAFTVFMVVGRLISGVHWFTDIVGGLIFSVSVILLYCAANNFVTAKKALSATKSDK